LNNSAGWLRPFNFAIATIDIISIKFAENSSSLPAVAARITRHSSLWAASLLQSRYGIDGIKTEYNVNAQT
jgi:hypothetical protein